MEERKGSVRDLRTGRVHDLPILIELPEGETAFVRNERKLIVIFEMIFRIPRKLRWTTVEGVTEGHT